MTEIAGQNMIPKTAEYALRACTYLATRPQQPRSADALAAQTKVPRRYLTRVMQDLAAAGMVTSRSGPGGGYVLAAAPPDVTMLDIIIAVSPIERIESCPLGIASHRSLCPLHAELDRAYAAVEAAFAAVTLQQLVTSTPFGALCECETG